MKRDGVELKAAPETPRDDGEIEHRRRAEAVRLVERERLAVLAAVDEVRLLRSEYRLFKEQYLEHVPDGTDITCSDAFLEYITTYGPAALEFLKVSKMKRQMKRTVRRMKYRRK